MKSVKIGLIGAGTIGKGIIELISSNKQLIADRTGVSLEVKAICDKDAGTLKDIGGKNVSVKTADANDLINDVDIDIIVELIGGINPAKEIILSALKNKKHVVTANKALLSGHWKDIFDTASASGVLVNFEASVGGAIPIIRTIRESFVADKINVIYGILNGTTNFILTKMDEEHCSFDDALKVAQEKGIAESDPELDISGKDSAHKLAILSLLGFGKDISPEDIFTEGIENIEPEDIARAYNGGYSVKLLAIAKNTSAGLELRVHPTLLPESHLLSGVKGEDNAIFVKGEFIEDSLLFGKGAGRRPTAGSVVGDIVEIAKHVAFDKEDAAPYNLNYSSEDKNLKAMEELDLSYYLRFSVIDNPGVLAGISSVLSENEISIASVLQEERNQGEIVPVIIVTHKAKEGRMMNAISRIDKMDCIKNKTVVIRIEE